MTAPERTDIDPILATVLQRKLRSISREMGMTLLRTTRSPVLSEAKDFATGLYDPQGRVLEQSQHVPLLAFCLSPACREIVEQMGDEICEGDVILHNDVFSGGNQYADVAAFKPIFLGGKLVAWAGAKGHMLDIGGAVKGGMNAKATEAWQEALRIPPVKVIEKGVLRKDVWNLIFTNVRMRSIVESDIRAEIGSCAVGERAMKGLYERYGLDRVQRHIEHVLNATERRVRDEIRNIPDGTYYGEARADHPGIGKGYSDIRLAVTVKDDEILFDFAGTDPQTPGYVNAPLTASMAGVVFCFLMLVDPTIAFDDGLLRPVHINIPAGCILNAEFPAATSYGNHLTDQVCDAIFRALAGPLKHRVTAGWIYLGTYVSGTNPISKRSFVCVAFFANKGGSGATHGLDGYPHIGSIRTGGALEAEDNEMFEIHHPHFRLRRHEYACDSGGPGRWRGGLGVETDFEMNAQDMMVAVYGGGTEEGAFGLFGGKPGSLNHISITFPDGTLRVGAAKENIEGIPPGSVFHKRAGGGGGFGPPEERPMEIVWDDVRNGFVSVESAKEDYGVVVDAESMQLDVGATEALRKSRRHTTTEETRYGEGTANAL